MTEQTAPFAGELAAFAGIDAVVLLPTLNEERGLSVTLGDVPFGEAKSRRWSVRPLIIDGGSTDRTREVAKAHGVTVVPQRGRGKGSAIREGLELLRGLGVRYAVVLDADATYPGSALLPALELLDSGSDLVVGVRQPEIGAPRSFRDLVHRVGNILLNFAAGQYSRSTYLDLTSGFWALRVDKAPELHLITDNFGIEAELFLKAHRYGWHISQIPIGYRQRVGSPKLHAVPDGMRILLTILRFGRRTLQAAPLPLGEAPGILRELLLTAFIQGYHDVELLYPPTLQVEAQRIAQRLQRTGIAPYLVRRETPPASGAAAPTPSATPSRSSTSASISLRFGPKGRLLRVELLDLPPSARPEGDAAFAPQTFRSGAYMNREPKGRADLLDPLRLVGHRLNVSDVAKRRELLSANGIRVVPVSEGEAILRSPLIVGGESSAE